MDIHKYNQAMKHITRSSDKLSKDEKKKILKDFYEPKPKKMGIVKYINTMNRLYGNSKTDEYGNEETATTRIQEQDKKPVKVSGIKDSSLYKLLENPKVLGVELGHDTIMEVINLIQNSGLVKKPKKEPAKIAVVEKPKKEIDHIALLSNGEEFVV